MKPYDKVAAELAEKAEEKLGDKLVSLVLYGSAAKGTATDESDADIFAVVVDSDAKEELFDLSFEIGMKRGVLFSVVVRTLEELVMMREMGSIYLKEVSETGKMLYGEAVG